MELQDKHQLRNPFLSDAETEAGIDMLLSEMTLQEKIGQLTQLGTFDEESDMELVEEGMVGSLLGVRGADNVNAIQRAAVEQSRLGIPLLFADDVIHGYRSTFPIPLAEASSWNPELLEETAAIAAREASSDGINWILAPMVDIARDARWGRIAEGAGEDPYLGSVVAAARVRGIQRNDWTDRPHIMACPKHFAAYGLAEGGRDYNTVDISETRMRETYFPPFQAALDAGAGTMMAAFNEINGVPASANRWLLKDVLQGEWGFQGFVVSDWESVDEIVQHGFAADREQAGAEAMNAGMHMDMHSLIYHEHLANLLEKGEVSLDAIDDAVRRILRVKYRLGLFTHPYQDNTLASTYMLNPAHLETAREMARQSIVLLKNEGSLLPIAPSVRKLAVIGPLAEDVEAQLGCWRGQGRPEDVVSVLAGIRSLAEAQGAEVVYAAGSSIREAGDTSELARAVRLAAESELAIVVLGESADMSGENNSRVSLDIPEPQMELLQAVHATGVPVVLVLSNGRPLTIEWAAAKIPAIVNAWHLGVQAGPALADVLFGAANPSGKLPVTFPRHAGQVPIYYNAKKTGRPHMKRYADADITPLYTFGHGLSYTSFSYEELQLEQTVAKLGESVTVSARISNTGDRDGVEIVQLYICDEAASVTRPVKELKGFSRITLKAGESRTVTFTLGTKKLGFINSKHQFVVEPGKFKVWIGPSSAEGLEGSFEIIG
ncbi:beta-glucosidase [Paenibacillus taihuensis]|uniref:Beta-glucosidase n=1 Tax=Paenibacillus taihuensis TaxID=1156355 RepID=A0A3D9R3I0_9BACL|nr:glycoside hydrolase family 3 N-terminal domain-containing protein [Paenibacillus taihuensis]REE70569.1 beta-glucosidase [Paenibacillus taihuensis]